MAEVRPHWKRCLEHRAELAASGRTSPELERFRWMIEEFRVSLFAQELRTAAPVSAQRLARLWQQLP
jgi:ATP-dependent helicase HrpA